MARVTSTSGAISIGTSRTPAFSADELRTALWLFNPASPGGATLSLRSDDSRTDKGAGPELAPQQHAVLDRELASLGYYAVSSSGNQNLNYFAARRVA